MIYRQGAWPFRGRLVKRGRHLYFGSHLGVELSRRDLERELGLLNNAVPGEIDKEK